MSRASSPRGRAMRQVLITLLVAALIAPNAAIADDDAPATVGFGVCDMMVTAMLDSGPRLQTFLPAGYEVGANWFTAGTKELGVLMAWVLDCDSIQLPGGPEQAVISFLTIVIDSPDRPSDITTTPRNFDLYAVFAHTNSEAVATWLGADGIPTTVVPDIDIDRSDEVTVRVPDADAGYTLSTRPSHPDVIGGVHTHNNVFWHDDGNGIVGTMRLAIPNATDIACYFPCGNVAAGSRTASADLLGDEERMLNYTFDHVGLSAVTGTLTTRTSS